MRRKVLARAVHHKRLIAYLGRSTPSDGLRLHDLAEKEAAPPVVAIMSASFGRGEPPGLGR
jgi:hypothetical protein